MDYTFRKYLETLAVDSTPVVDDRNDNAGIPGELDQDTGNAEAAGIFQQVIQTSELLSNLLQQLHDAHLDPENKEHVERIQLEIQALMSNLQTIHV